MAPWPGLGNRQRLSDGPKVRGSPSASAALGPSSDQPDSRTQVTPLWMARMQATRSS